MGLFDVEKITEKIYGEEFNSFNLKDKDVFDRIYFSVDKDILTWEHSFTHLYPYSLSLKSHLLLWKMINNSICVFEYSTKKERIFMYCDPVSYKDKEDYAETILLCHKLMNKINKKNNNSNCFNAHRISRIGEVFDLSTFKKSDIWTKKYDDFIFKCEDLIKLEGGKFKSRRGMVNRFKREYPNTTIRFADENDYDDIMAVRENWVNSRFKSSKDVWDYKVFPYVIKKYKELGVKITVAVVNGKIEGFFVMAKLCINCSTILNENTNTEIHGLAEYLWYESLRLNSDLGEYENDANGGKETDGLYSYKMSHNPVCLVEKIGFCYNGNDVKFKKSIYSKYKELIK